MWPIGPRSSETYLHEGQPPQVIPRPLGAVPGRRAPWAELSAEQRSKVPLDAVRRALVQPRESAPAYQNPTGVVPAELPATGRARTAGVLCLVYEGARGEARVVLTRRDRRLLVHAGEIAFPGGRVEAGESPLGAALREASEEVAVDISTVEVIGELTPLATRLSSALVHCFVAVFPGPTSGGLPGPDGCRLRPGEGEVEEIFCPALGELMQEGVFHEELWPVEDEEQLRAVPFFRLAGYAGAVVWGATGRMLYELLSAVSARPGPRTTGG